MHMSACMCMYVYVGMWLGMGNDRDWAERLWIVPHRACTSTIAPAFVYVRM